MHSLRFSLKTVDGLPAPGAEISVRHKFGLQKNIRDVEITDNVHRFLLSHHKQHLARFPVGRATWHRPVLARATHRLGTETAVTAASEALPPSPHDLQSWHVHVWHVHQLSCELPHRIPRLRPTKFDKPRVPAIRHLMSSASPSSPFSCEAVRILPSSVHQRLLPGVRCPLTMGERCDARLHPVPIERSRRSLSRRAEPPSQAAIMSSFCGSTVKQAPHTSTKGHS